MAREHGHVRGATGQQRQLRIERASHPAIRELSAEKDGARFTPCDGEITLGSDPVVGEHRVDQTEQLHHALVLMPEQNNEQRIVKDRA